MSKKPIPLPDHARLLEVFDYDPDTGFLMRRPRPRSEFGSNRDFEKWRTRWCSKPAGCPKPAGIAVEIDGLRYQAHRLIWKMIHGDPVPDVIDHKDGDNQNNRLNNLRAATDGQNTTNGPVRKDNALGVKGVSYDPQRKKFVVQVDIGGRRVYMKRFDTLEEATEARRKAAERIHGEFARHE